jgi:hypothetical protein
MWPRHRGCNRLACAPPPPSTTTPLHPPLHPTPHSKLLHCPPPRPTPTPRPSGTLYSRSSSCWPATACSRGSRSSSSTGAPNRSRRCAAPTAASCAQVSGRVGLWARYSCGALGGPAQAAASSACAAGRAAPGAPRLPAAGEKAALKHDGKLARRAAREAARGFDLLQLSADMMALIERDGDMAALPMAGLGGPGKYGHVVAHKLAGLYGLASSFQVGRVAWARVLEVVGRASWPRARPALRLHRGLVLAHRLRCCTRRGAAVGIAGCLAWAIAAGRAASLAAPHKAPRCAHCSPLAARRSPLWGPRRAAARGAPWCSGARPALGRPARRSWSRCSSTCCASWGCSRRAQQRARGSALRA